MGEGVNGQLIQGRKYWEPIALPTLAGTHGEQY
jgi:hypothetical protein